MTFPHPMDDKTGFEATDEEMGLPVLTCEHCDAPVRSDFDGCYCDDCKQNAWEMQQERLMSDGPGPSLLDQQREAMKFK